MRFCFVILHYLVPDVTMQCADILLGNFTEAEIVLVDNASPDGSGDMLQSRYGDNGKVHLLRLPENLGFAGGNNAGYGYAVEKLNPDFVVVMNNDVFIRDAAFTQKVLEEYRKRPFAVLGPDIVTPDGHHQNPLRPSPMTSAQAKRLRSKMRIKLALFPLFYFSGLCDSPVSTRTDIPEAATGCVLHGSCLIFSRDFTSARPYAFNPSTFLYCEEDILGVECSRQSLTTRYSPAMAVGHLEDRSTKAAHKSGFRRSRQKYLNLVRSLNVLVRACDRVE